MYVAGMIRADPTMAGTLGTYQPFSRRAVEISHTPTAIATDKRTMKSSFTIRIESRKSTPSRDP
jgi:hypothetical protein